jgi:hypothetical protein
MMAIHDRAVKGMALIYGVRGPAESTYQGLSQTGPGRCVYDGTSYGPEALASRASKPDADRFPA